MNALELFPKRLVISLLLVVVLGCGSGDDRRAVSGSVTVDDVPLAMGSISFGPVAADATGAGSAIVDGKFSIPNDKGLKPGQYQVTISGARETGKIINDYQRGKIAEKVPLTFKESMPLPQTISDSNSNSLVFSIHTFR